MLWSSQDRSQELWWKLDSQENAAKAFLFKADLSMTRTLFVNESEARKNVSAEHQATDAVSQPGGHSCSGAPTT